MQKVAKEMAGKGAVAQVNTEENPQIAARFNIRGIPTIILFQDGREIDRMSGAMEKDALLSWWRQQISKFGLN